MKIVLPFLMVALLVTSVAIGQEVPKSPTAKFLYKRGYTFPGAPRSKRSDRWPDTLFYNTTYRAKMMGSPTIPITFSRAEFVDGKYQVTPTISVGYGYTWFFGHFIFSENDKIIVDPTFFFGLVADIGLQDNFNLFKPAGLFAGGFIGVQALSLFAGYDFVTKSPTIGLGTRIDLYTLRQKSLRPIGKISVVRRHKRLATPIDDE
jgi:hypothetical protein